MDLYQIGKQRKKQSSEKGTVLQCSSLHTVVFPREIFKLIHAIQPIEEGGALLPAKRSTWERIRTKARKCIYVYNNVS